MAIERQLLRYSSNGDRILLGFSRHKDDPAIEHIRKMAAGSAPGLKLLSAKRLDATSKIAYDHVAKKIEDVPWLQDNGNFILLRCITDDARPAELLGPAFDLGGSLSGDGVRIFYNHVRSVRKEQWFEVTEARLKDSQVGTVFLDCMKVLHAVEELSRPVALGGSKNVRNEVMNEAYHAYLANTQANPDANWQTGQRRRVARIANYLNGVRENQERNMSGKIRTDGMSAGMAPSWGEDAYTVLSIVGFLEVMNAVKANGGIHLEPATIPYGHYIDALLAKTR